MPDTTASWHRERKAGLPHHLPVWRVRCWLVPAIGPCGRTSFAAWECQV